MRFCLFGTYTIAEGYPVNRVLATGLERAGHTVEVCRVEAWGPFVHRTLSKLRPLGLLRLAWRLLRAHVRLARRYRRAAAHDWVLVGYPGYLDVHLARRLSRCPVALVSFISVYDTIVGDRGRLGEASWPARLLWRVDRAAFRAADAVLVDTDAQARYYAERFGLEPERFVRSFVGEDDDLFARRPARPRRDVLEVLFFGTYVPLHGIDTILDAAQLLRDETDVRFTLVGSGQLYEPLRERARRLDLAAVFVGRWVSSAELVDRIDAADVCLGIFGTTAKAARVIPYKVFDALAVGRAVVTRDSPAIRELLTHETSALLCPPGDPPALAAAVRRLRDDDALRQRLAKGGHGVYRERGCPTAIGRDLAHTLGARPLGARHGATCR